MSILDNVLLHSKASTASTSALLDTAAYRSYNLFGAKITPTTTDELLDLLRSHIDRDAQCVVASQNLHGLHVRLWDAASRQLHDMPNTFVHIDGMPIVALCRLAGIAAKRAHRVTLNDFIWPLLELAAARGWRVAYIGSTPEVLEAARGAIGKRLPHLQFMGHHGHFRNTLESREAAALIGAFRPELVLVGMGMGVQERWILRHARLLAPASIVTVGACMEYVAGSVKTPPRWMGHAGVEWLFRLVENPTRFWYRYLVEPWFVLGYIAWYLSLPEKSRSAGQPEEIPYGYFRAGEVELSETAG